MLSDLEYLRIPKLLANFELADNSRVLILEYKSGQTLAVRRSYSPDQIKIIIVQVLETLMYCQEEKIPDIIHKDIKPANILVDLSTNPLQISIVDFGIARRGRVELGATTMVQGADGYIAPEQRLRKSLGKSADLYGLGATIVYLLRSDLQQPEDINELIDTRNTINFQNKEVSEFSLPFLKWLDRLVQPVPEDRFASAKDALKALMPLYVKRVPEVKFFKDGMEFDLSKTVLEFHSTRLGDKLTQTIRLKNSVPETNLEGHWEVEPHPNDPPHTPDNHFWIYFNRQKFVGNDIEFEITVDTSKLIAQGKGNRNIKLQLNDSNGIYSFTVKVITAHLPIKKNYDDVDIVFDFLIPFFGGGLATHWSIFLLPLSGVKALSSSIVLVGINGFFLALIFLLVCFYSSKILFDYKNRQRLSFLLGIILSISIACNSLVWIDINWWSNLNVIGLNKIEVKAAIFEIERFRKWISMYTSYIYGGALTGISCLVYIFFYEAFSRQRKIAAYRRKEEHLIKP